MHNSTLKGGAAEAAAKSYMGGTGGGASDCEGPGSATGIGGNLYLTQQEAAAYLRLSPRTLERHRVEGTGSRFVKLGRRVLYRRSDLDDWAATLVADDATGEAGEDRRKGGQPWQVRHVPIGRVCRAEGTVPENPEPDR